MAYRVRELGHLAAPTYDLQRVAFHHGDAGRVVTAVFELGESIE
jgi:hypothetical protein